MRAGAAEKETSAWIVMLTSYHYGTHTGIDALSETTMSETASFSDRPATTTEYFPGASGGTKHSTVEIGQMSLQTFGTKHAVADTLTRMVGESHVTSTSQSFSTLT